MLTVHMSMAVGGVTRLAHHHMTYSAGKGQQHPRVEGESVGGGGRWMETGISPRRPIAAGCVFSKLNPTDLGGASSPSAAGGRKRGSKGGGLNTHPVSHRQSLYSGNVAGRLS